MNNKGEVPVTNPELYAISDDLINAIAKIEEQAKSGR